MAAQQGVPVVVPPAQLVGNAFVNQYYNVLHQSPSMVYRFYQECSKLGRPDPNGEMLTVTTMDGINNMIMSLDYNDFKAVIKSVDSQESYNNGVLVLVTGSLSCKISGTRNFTQSFFLAPQDKGFFVLNDVFKYLDEESEQTSQNLVLMNDFSEQSVKVPSPEPVVEPKPVAENGVIEQPTSIEVGEPVVEEEYNPPEHEVDQERPGCDKEAVPERVPATIYNEAPPAPEAAPSVIQDAPKKSYASIVKVMKENAAPVAVQRPLPARAFPANVERLQAASTATKASSIDLSNHASPNAMEYSTSPEEEANGCSIYIKNLPVNVTAFQLEEEFKKFGAIKPNGVQVRSKQGAFCYGFVDFEAGASVQSAIEASPIMISGRQAYVEEKRPSSGTRVTRGRFVSARGGFRNDGIRGRGAYGGRGNGRTDFANRGDLGNRARGSVSGRSGGFSDAPEGYQRDDQIRNGGRGPRRGGMITSNGNMMTSVAA
eukprot:Gb_11766 [translate_table: standard]